MEVWKKALLAAAIAGINLRRQVGGVFGAKVFAGFTKAVSRASGHAVAVLGAIIVILAWALAGPIFHFSDTWQLTINTATTVVTFLMVFVIQNSQTRDMEALQIKVDEIVRATAGADHKLLDLEELPEAELRRIQKEYEALAAKARAQQGGRRGKPSSQPASVEPEKTARIGKP